MENLVGKNHYYYGRCLGCEACPHPPWGRRRVISINKAGNQYILDVVDEIRKVTKYFLYIIPIKYKYVFLRRAKFVGIPNKWINVDTGELVILELISKEIIKLQNKNKAQQYLNIDNNDPRCTGGSFES